MKQLKLNMVSVKFLLFFLMSWTMQTSDATKLFAATFRTNSEGFSYRNNTFSNATKNGYSSGRFTTTESGGLVVTLGGKDNLGISNMSGGWIKDFSLSKSSNVNLTNTIKYYAASTAICSVFDQA
jgi:hypothetical protein